MSLHIKLTIKQLNNSLQFSLRDSYERFYHYAYIVIFTLIDR